jgi:hypothetical protein
VSLYLFISRKPDPTTDEGPDITEQEWRELLAGEFSLRPPLPEEIEVGVPGGVAATDVALPSQDGTVTWVSWAHGQLEVKNASQSAIARMALIADKLSARVVSETGEVFDGQGAHAGFEPWSEFYVPEKKPSFFSRLFRKPGGT